MTTRKPVEGQKAGSKQKQPFRAKVTATTVMKAAILYGLTVGEARLFGTAPTEVDVLSRIYLDGTPIMDVNGTKLLDAEVEWRNGTIDQTVIEGMPSVSLPQDISAEVKYGVPLSRTMVTRDVTAYDIMLNIPQLYRGDAEGNSYAGTVAIKVEADNGDGIFVDFGTHTFEEKVINGFNPVITINVPKADSHTIRVTKLTPDATDEFSANAVAVYTITEIIEVRMAYPCTALLFVKYDAEQFSNIPKLEVRFFGVSDLLIPANYYPDDNRTYATTGVGTTNGVWDGTWKKGYSDNPIWHWLAIATNKQWGIGNRINISMIDKWELYRLAKYCDQLVPDGKGGQEPRFTCNNLYLNTAEDAYKVFKDLSSLIRGATIYDGQFLRPRIDTPRDAVHIFSQANVKDLRYSTVEDGAAHNVVHVQYYDKENRFATKVVTRRDKDDIRDRGSYFPLELAAFGVSSEGQAQRAAEYILASELTETEMIAFTTGLEGITPLVGDVFLFADNYTAGKAISGRIKAINGTQVTLDRLIDPDNVNGSFIVNTTNNAVATRKIVAINGAVITLDSALDSYSHPFLVWAIISETLGIPEFYIIESKYNAEDSTWSISGLQYSRKKYNKIDLASRIESPPFTSIVPNGISAPALLTLSYTSRIAQDMNVYSITAAWSDVTGASAYSLDMRKDGDTWVNLGRIYALTFDVDNVYEGIYEFRVRAVDVLGNYSPYTLSQPLQMRGKVLPPPVLDNYVVTGVLFGFKHSWAFPAHTEDSRGVRLRFSATDPSGSIQPLVTEIDKAYPATTHEDIGVPSGTTRWFSAAIVDKYGIVGQYTNWISAATSDDPDEILELIKGHVGIEAIDAELAAEIQTAKGNAAEALNTANQVRDETRDAVNELVTDISTERDDRIAAVSQLQDGVTNVQNNVDGLSNDLTNYKQTTSNTLSNLQQTVNVAASDAHSAVEQVTALDSRVDGAENTASSALSKANTNATDISAVSGRVDTNTAQIANKADTTYVNSVKSTADAAEGKATANTTAIQGLQARVGNNESTINNIQQTKANKDEVASIAQTALQSTWQNDAQAKVDELQIGGANVITGTRDFDTSGNLKPNYAGFGSRYDDPNDKLFGTNVIYFVIESWRGFYFTGFKDDKAPEDMTLSFWASVQNNETVSVTNFANSPAIGMGTVSGSTWKQYSFKIPKGTALRNSNSNGVVEFGLPATVGTVVAYGAIQLQYGNKATDWQPSPLDTKVGGRNLLRMSNFPNKNLDGWTFYAEGAINLDYPTATIDGNTTNYIYISGSGYGGVYQHPTVNIQNGQTYTLSFWAKGDGQIRCGAEDGAQNVFFNPPTDRYQKFVITDVRRDQNNLTFSFYKVTGTYADIVLPKLELGNVATAWSPAPEDEAFARQQFEATVTNTYSTKADTNSAIASGIQQYDAGVSTSLPTEPDASRANQWLWTEITMSSRTDWDENTIPDYSWLRKAATVNRNYLADGDTLKTNWWINTIVFFRTVVSTAVAKTINLGNFTGDDGHAIYVNQKRVFGWAGYATNPVSFTLPSGVSVIDIAISNGAGGAGFSAQNNLSGQVDWMRAPKSTELQSNANASAITQTQVEVTNLGGQVSSLASQTNTLTSSVTAIKNTGQVNSKAVIIDLTGYDTGKAFPIGIPLYYTRNTIRVWSTLDGLSHPSWANHSNGFVLEYEWNVSPYGWGTRPVNREITNASWNWTKDNTPPLIKFDQMENSSIEVVWLRGGGAYRAFIPDNSNLVYPDGDGKIESTGQSVWWHYYNEFTPPDAVFQKTTQNTVTLQQQAQVIDGIQAKWTVKINNNGYAAGFGLISTPNNGAIVSAFMVDADAFVVGKAGTNIKPIVSVSGGQTVEGIYYPESGTYLNTAWISKASIGTAHINDLAVKTANIDNLAVTTAKIDNAAITTAKIGVAEIDTLRIQGRAVTVPYYYTDTNPVSIDARFGDFPVSSSGSRTVPVVSAFSASGFTPYAEVFIVCDVGILISGLYDSANGEAVSVRLLQGYYDTASGNTPNAKRIDRAKTITYYDDPSSPNVGTRWEVTNKSCGAFSRKMTADAYGNIALSLWVSAEGNVRNFTRLIVKPETEITWYVQELKR